MGLEDSTGKIPPGRGTLYKLNDTGCFQNLQPVLPGVTISNGMAWNADGTRMYYIDSPTRQIALFDYDPATTNISKGFIFYLFCIIPLLPLFLYKSFVFYTANRRTFYDFKTDNLPGVPDGMTIDDKGNLWIANYDGAQVYCQIIDV